MYDRILYAHDFSILSKAALRTALDLGRQLKATVNVLHVVTPPTTIPPGLWLSVPEPDLASFEEKVRLAAAQELARQVLEVSCEGDPGVHLHVNLGEPAETILAKAREVDAGLIVMGTHGRKGWQHFMLGSVAERVLRTSPVPVLTISPQAAEVRGSVEPVTEARA
jgi:nucleotide-binding universal stress UspA family protein